MQKNSILLIGGDQRQKELYTLLKNKNYDVNSYGLFNEEEIANSYDVLILPFPAYKDGFINTPFYNKKISFNEVTSFINNHTKIIGGKLPKNIFNNNFVFDYSDNENLVYFNAFLTAEAAISIAINNSKKSLYGSNILITGMGRIAKHLAFILKAFNSSITICARKESDRAFANSLGLKSIKFNELQATIKKYDFVFNTVPMVIFTNDILKLANTDTLFIDLASVPGGFETNKNANIIVASALPGKYSPATAAEIIFKTIEPFLNKEEKTWKT